ncbi:hypothetical protein N0V86_008750 [Didymella sp. IMI 355093]|nr:hypothetical protein N0V86_008750 [Didymella sp. IMI 355093]
MEKIGGLLVENLVPGPLHLMALPELSSPATPVLSPNNVLALSLYYRWALQALSAMSFFHQHGIFLRVFSSQMVWLRSDFSLAITGFINAVTNDDYPYTNSSEEHLRDQTSREYYDELPCEDDGMVTDEWIRYDEDGKEIPGIKEDLFQWATFVWRLMTNGEQSCGYESWEPNSPRPGDSVADYGQNADTRKAAMLQRAADGLEWQQLEEEQLGKVLVKAWNGGYESVEEVTKDVQMVAETISMSVIADEIDIGTPWENALEVVEGKGEVFTRELRLKTCDMARIDGWMLVQATERGPV